MAAPSPAQGMEAANDSCIDMRAWPCFAFTLLTAASVHATEPAARPARATSGLWQETWPTFSYVEGASTVLSGMATAALAIWRKPEQPNWQGGILFDDAVRDSLRLSSPKARQTARSIGDWPYYTAAFLPLVVDPLVALGFAHDGKAALNLELIGLEAFSYAGLLSFVSTRISVRERPDVTECRRHSPDPASCGSDNEAFWSGHTSIVAASAGLVCANHRFMALWGGGLADAGACALASSAALVTGVSRVMADRHYATDVLFGVSVGFGFGFGVPTLLHYTRTKPSLSVTLVPVTVGEGALFSVAGPL